MNVREGGSYVADPTTGEVRRVEGTVQEAQSRELPAEQPVAALSPQSQPVAEPAASRGRRPAGIVQAEE